MAGCSDSRAAVVDDASRVIGIISPSDVIRAIHLDGLRGWGPYDGLRVADLAAIIRPRA